MPAKVESRLGVAQNEDETDLTLLFSMDCPPSTVESNCVTVSADDNINALVYQQPKNLKALLSNMKVRKQQPLPKPSFWQMITSMFNFA